MIERKNLLFALFLVSCIFLSMSFISANNITDDNSQSNNCDDFILSDSQNKSFNDLNNEINGDLNKTEIIFNDDYINQGDFYDVVILINHSVTIDGQNHVIDANHISGIFDIVADNVVLKNIKFLNSNQSTTIFAAVSCFGNNISIINCSFINNYGGAVTGSAIAFHGSNMTIINSIFMNNYCICLLGSVITFADDSEGVIINSTFIDNYIIHTADMIDAAIYYDDDVFNVLNETISYGLNNKSEVIYRKVLQEVYFVNSNVIIINSTFKNNPTHSLYCSGNAPEFNVIICPIFPVYENSTKDNQINSSNPVNSNQLINKKKICIILKGVKVKKSAKKLVLQAILKQGKSLLKNKKVAFKFKGKNYIAKTNAKGIAKVTIKKEVLKKLKSGKKITYKASYGKISAKKIVKVIK